MAETFLGLLTSAHGAPAYGLVFAVLLACGLGLPLPEDVSLITGGYLSHVGAVHFAPMLLVSFAGILAGDFLIFSAGRRFGNDLAFAPWLSRLVPAPKIIRAEAIFARYGEGLVLAARFLPGLRAVTYFVAGASPMRAWRFVLFDGLAACVSAPLWMWLGETLGAHQALLFTWVERVHVALFSIGAVGVLVLAFALVRRSRRVVCPEQLQFDSTFEHGQPDRLAR